VALGSRCGSAGGAALKTPYCQNFPAEQEVKGSLGLLAHPHQPHQCVVVPAGAQSDLLIADHQRVADWLHLTYLISINSAANNSQKYSVDG
jgi:hypothetical protein